MVKITIEIPDDMRAWLESHQLGKIISGHIGGQEMLKIEDRIVHLLDVSEYRVDLNPAPDLDDEIPF